MAPAFTFRKMDVEKDRETLLKIRKDSFLVSLGTTEGFGDPNYYLAWIALQTIFYPDGFLLMEDNGKVVGQLEVEVIPFQGRRVGYVDLFYLVPEYRGKGYGAIQVKQAENYLRQLGMTEYHLRVSATNKRAIRFYEKHGFYKLMEENVGGYPMWRMVKNLI